MKTRSTKYPEKFKEQFYGVDDSCSLMAIAFMFGIGAKQIQFFFKLAGYKKDGTTNYQCRKVISILANSRNKTVRYTPNRYKLKVTQFLKQNARGSFILNQDGHVAPCINGQIIDNWGTDSFKLMGWWRIYHHDELLCNKCEIKFERVMFAKPNIFDKREKRLRL